ncbi:hypothetical protein ACH434_23060 [Lysinibacillus fusiformis]|uniref:hypothetical protein n=1 Tax=Lysinibacillus fusiformis TaxID=28031 RepID=UPI0037B4F005
MELKQLPRESTLALVVEVKESAQHFKEESQNAQNEIDDLRERKNVLQSAKGKTRSGAAMTIIQNMIDEIETTEGQLKDRIRLCNNNHKYYVEITRVLEEALKEFN